MSFRRMAPFRPAARADPRHRLLGRPVDGEEVMTVDLLAGNSKAAGAKRGKSRIVRMFR